MSKVYAISFEKNNFDLSKDIEILKQEGIGFEYTKTQNVILIDKRYLWTINGKWRLKGVTPILRWYGSKGIKDFLERFYWRN